MRPERDDTLRDLERQLSAAGDRARRAERHAAPDRAWASALRSQLTTEAAVAGDRARRPFLRWAGPLPRLVPVAGIATMVLVGAVAGRQLYVALGNDPTPTPAPSLAPASPDPEATPDEGPVSLLPEPTPGEATPAPTPEPTSVHTPEPTAAPTPHEPTPEPTPVIGSLSLTAFGCHGGVVLGWSTYAGEAPFNHYTTLRNTAPVIPLAYPPAEGAVDPGGTYTTVWEKTSAADDGVEAGTTYYYRTMAFNADDGVIAASDIVSAVAKPVKALGTLSVSDLEGTTLTWSPYDGAEACFSFYKIAFSETNPEPNYLAGDPYLAALSGQLSATYTEPMPSERLLSGHTYYFRVQVIRVTALGGFLVAQTDVATYTVP